MLHFVRLTTRKTAMIALLSALYYIMSFLPGIKVAQGAASPVTIQIEALMATIFGLVMGPYLGALTALMGAFIAWMLPPGSPSLTSLIFLPSPVMNAFTVGLIYRGKWKIAASTLVAVILAFWLLPATQPWDQNFYVGLFAMWDKIGALILILPSIYLLKKRANKISGGENVSDKKEKKRLFNATFILLVVAAVLMLVNAWVVVTSGNPKYQFEFLGSTFKLNLVSKEMLPFVSAIGYGWFSLGISMLACIVLLHIMPEKRRLWSIATFALSCVSAIIGGGYIVGLFLGVLGSFYEFLAKKLSEARHPLYSDIVVFFLLAFVGNEADNALGNLIFGLPQVYEGLFLMSVEALRLSFLTLPFFYFGVRLLQAIITTMIATPLMRNLKLAGFLEST